MWCLCVWVCNIERTFTLCIYIYIVYIHYISGYMVYGTRSKERELWYCMLSTFAS